MQRFPSSFAKRIRFCVLSRLGEKEVGFSCQSANVQPRRIELRCLSCVNSGSSQKNENSTVLKPAVALTNKYKAVRYPDCMRSGEVGTAIQSFLFFSCLTEVLTAERIWNIQIHFLFQIIQLNQSNISFPTFLTVSSPEFAVKVQLNVD